MMRRLILLAVLLFGAIGVTVVAMAQSPVSPFENPPAEPATPAVPRTLPGMATTPITPGPASVAEVPLSQFEPLSAYPHQTQSAVRGVLMGANWMTRMNQPQGRFVYGYNPALRQALAGDHDLKQARGALGLAQAARFTGDEKQAVMASQTVLTLLAATKLDPADPSCREPVHNSMLCNRVGFAAVVALAIYELPGADVKLLAEAERLCEFLRRQCKPDGSIRYTDNPTEDSTKVDPDGANEYPGMALHAIIVGNRVKPAAWKTETVKKSVEYYRTAFRAKPHPLFAATLTPAFAEFYLQTKIADSAAAVYEMNDWLCGLQIPSSDPRTPQWAGAFRAVVDGRQSDVPPGVETGLYVQSLAYACVLTRHTPDLDRNRKYKSAITDGVQFLTGLQYLEPNTRHFETTFRANMLIGGFHLSPTDGNLRIDATGIALTGLLKFLSSGVEK